MSHVTHVNKSPGTAHSLGPLERERERERERKRDTRKGKREREGDEHVISHM